MRLEREQAGFYSVWAGPSAMHCLGTGDLTELRRLKELADCLGVVFSHGAIGSHG